MKNLNIKSDELNVQNFNDEVELQSRSVDEDVSSQNDSEKSKDELFRLRESRISEELINEQNDSETNEQNDSETNEENNVKPINSVRLKEIIENSKNRYYFKTEDNFYLNNSQTVGGIFNSLTNWLHNVEFMKRVDDLKLYICKEFDSIKHQKEDVHPYEFIGLNWEHFVGSDKNTSTYVVNNLRTLFRDRDGYIGDYFYESELLKRLNKIWFDTFKGEDLDNLKKEDISDEVIRKTKKIENHLLNIDGDLYSKNKDILSTNNEYLCEEIEEDGRVYSYEFDRYVLESLQKLFPSEDITHWVEIITKRLVCPISLLKDIEFSGVRPHLRPYHLVLKSILSYKSQFMS